MGLAVTVQKGHNFSSGTIDRAALNNGATPTVSITGSVGLGEIGSEAIVDDNIKTNADIAVSKLALTEGSLILGGSDGNAAALAPSSSYNHGTLGNEADKNCGLLIDTGTNKWQVLNTDVSVGGQVSITKYRADSDSPFILKLKVVDGSLSASHINKDTTLDMASLAKNSGGKLCVADNGVHWDKFYNHKNSAGNLRSAFLSYGVDGKAIPAEITEANQVLVSAGSNANSVTNSFFKEVEILSELTAETKWYRKEHGLTNAAGTASVVPKFVKVMMVCKGTTKQAIHKYSVNDVIDIGHEWINDSDNASALIGVSYDATHIIVNYLGGNLAAYGQLPTKYGSSTTATTTSGTPASFVLSTDNSYQDFKLIAYVCG